MQKLVLILGVSLALWHAPNAFARRDCNVLVDCSTHEITVLGHESRIDCGKAGHLSHNGTGFIGGFHNGKKVHNGVKIEGIPGMGASGGGKVFHSVSWGPKGLNDSNGCIHVTPAVLRVLHTCQGSRLRIDGAGQPMRSRNPRYVRRRRPRNYEYERDDSRSYY